MDFRKANTEQSETIQKLKLWKEEKKLWISNCDKAQDLTFWKNSKTQIVKQTKKLNCDTTQNSNCEGI